MRSAYAMHSLIIFIVLLSSISTEAIGAKTVEKPTLLRQIRASWETLTTNLVSQVQNVASSQDAVKVPSVDEIAELTSFVSIVTQADQRVQHMTDTELTKELGKTDKHKEFRQALAELKTQAQSIQQEFHHLTPTEHVADACQECQKILDLWFPASDAEVRIREQDHITLTSMLCYLSAIKCLLQAETAKVNMLKINYLTRAAILLERGTKESPQSWEMSFELGWHYYDRLHQLAKAAEAFHTASEMPSAPAFISRMYYRSYEHLLDFDRLWPAINYAKTKYPEDSTHQKLITDALAWWEQHQDDPQEHRRQIINENTARKKRGLELFLYPNDPFWNVCPKCGFPTRKGETKCSTCRRYTFPHSSQP